MTTEACGVCGEALGDNRATCQQCGADFHLALRTDVPARDCGDAWIDDEVQALIFGCNRCLGKQQPAPERKRYARREGAGARTLARARGRQRGGAHHAS